MGIFSRLGTLIKSNLNDLISRAEDPEKMLTQVLVDMQQQLIEAKKSVAIAIADEKKLQKQYNLELDKSKDWERKAMLAVRSGNDDLAGAGGADTLVGGAGRDRADGGSSARDRCVAERERRCEL